MGGESCLLATLGQPVVIATLLSMMTKTINEIAETTNATPICGMVSEFIPVCTSVSAMRNAVIVAESATAPFMSMEGDVLFLLVLC